MPYTQISSTSGLISLGNTSARLRDSRSVYPQILESLNEFRRTNTGWERGIGGDQEQFAVLLGENDIFKISTKTVVGSAKDARAKTAFLSDLGLTNSTRILSDVGQELLRVKSKDKIEIKEFDLSEDSFIYLKQFLKYQHPGFEIKPILSLIYSILEFDNNLPIDFLTFFWSDSKSKEEIKNNITAFKRAQNTDQILYNKHCRSDNAIIANKNIDLFFGEFKIENKNELKRLIQSIFAFSKNKEVNISKAVNLLYDFYKYWINKDNWDLNKKKKYISEYLIARNEDFRTKSASSYKEYFFNVSRINNTANWNEIVSYFDSTLIMCSTDDKDFVSNFCCLYLFNKKMNLCEEYRDLNIRHLSLLDIFIFEHETVKLDLLFQYLFKPTKEELLEVDILGYDDYRIALETNQKKLGDIYDFLDVEPNSLSELIAIDHPEVENIGLKNFAYKKREERLTKLVKEVFTRENIITLFESIYPRNDKKIRKLLKEWYSDYDASIPALFEFLLGISFYWISEGKISLLDSLGMGLDANLLPKSHAPGGGADIEITSLPTHYLIEATLSENDGQRQMESEPVPRHLAKHLIKEENEAMALFVAGRLDPNNLVVLRSYKFLPWYNTNGDDKIDSMNILPLTVENVIYILKEGLKFDDFESKAKELLSSTIMDGKIWYEKEVNREFNYA